MAASVCRTFSRQIFLLRPLRDSLREPLKPAVISEIAEKHGKAALLWKKIFLFVCVPSIGLCAVNALLQEHPSRPEFRPYEHLRLRTKKFPWRDGVKTLFHNPHTNALPDGYEDEH